MNEYVFFLGSHPALSAIEVVAALTYGKTSFSISVYTKEYLILSTDQELSPSLLTRLGGTSRIARTIATAPELPTPVELLGLFPALPPKLAVGFSSLLTSQNIDLEKYGIETKKAARQMQIKVKFIIPAGKKRQLNAAQVLFNALYRSPNMEITFLEHDGNIRVVQTLAVQDIGKYEVRDTQRPARDARVGMLPPKLAQIMMNVAVGTSGAETPAILDPFCGSGTIPQEAWLLNIQSVGADASSNMIAASEKNLAWLYDRFPVKEELQPELVEHDSRQPYPEHWNGTFDAVVTEPFLGTPLSAPLSRSELATWQAPVIELYTKTFQNLHPVLKENGIVLFLFPAANVEGDGYTPLPHSIFDEISKAGYSMVQLVPEALQNFVSPTDRGTLMYSRPDALVAREFTLWKKIS